MAGKMFFSSSKKRTPSSDNWLKSVLQKHAGRDPDETRMRRAQQWEVCLRKCRAVRGLAMRTRALVGEVLRQMAESNTPGQCEVFRERWVSAQNATKDRAHRRIVSLDVATTNSDRTGNRQRSSSPNFGPCVPASTLRDASSSDESAMGEAARLIGAPNRRAMFEIANASSDSEASDSESAIGQAGLDLEIHDGSQQPPTKVGTLLKQLKIEPPNADECAAKFMLYEAYSTEVEDMRSTLIGFHKESFHLLPQAVATQMNHEIRAIDSKEAMGIAERTGNWFVYDMMHKAERNNLSMASKLDAFEKKLKFLAEGDQKECPICFDAFAEVDRKSETLACCHKVCTECWQRWCAFRRAVDRPVFCPCCHHQDFLGAVKAELGNVETGVSLSDSDGDTFDRTCSVLTRGRQGSLRFGNIIKQTCTVPRQTKTRTSL